MLCQLALEFNWVDVLTIIESLVGMARLVL